MKEIITKCNHCGAEIIGPNRLLTFNGEPIDLCSDQCRLKWWMAVANDAEAADSELHIISKPAEKKEEGQVDNTERKFKMLPGK